MSDDLKKMAEELEKSVVRGHVPYAMRKIEFTLRRAYDAGRAEQAEEDAEYVGQDTWRTYDTVGGFALSMRMQLKTKAKALRGGKEDL